MDEARVGLHAFRAALLMHQTRHVARYDVLRACVQMIAHLVLPHAHGDGLFRDRESAAETAAFIRSGRLDELDALHAFEQRAWFRKRLPRDFRYRRFLQMPQRAATVMQADAIRKLSPRKFARADHVMQKLDE